MYSSGKNPPKQRSQNQSLPLTSVLRLQYGTGTLLPPSYLTSATTSSILFMLIGCSTAIGRRSFFAISQFSFDQRGTISEDVAKPPSAEFAYHLLPRPSLLRPKLVLRPLQQQRVRQMTTASQERQQPMPSSERQVAPAKQGRPWTGRDRASQEILHVGRIFHTFRENVPQDHSQHVPQAWTP